jgi:hypothetical protein
MIRYRLMLSFLGVGLAIVAMARHDRRIAWIAMVVLAVSLVTRMIARRNERR